MFEFSVKENGGEVNVKLKGRLDATVAPELSSELAKFQGQDIKKVTFDAGELDYIASAGLRVIAFSKQKLGIDTQIFMKDVTEYVKSVIQMTGCDNFVTFV